MNEFYDVSSEEGDDRMLDEMLSQMKRLEPPLETRIGNRAAVAVELSRLATANRNRQLPWWRRKIPVPLPVALSLAVLLVVTFVVQWNLHRRSIPPIVHSESPAQSVERPASTQHEPTGIVMHTRNMLPVLDYYETETYLCGIGRLSSESGYLIRE